MAKSSDKTGRRTIETRDAQIISDSIYQAKKALNAYNSYKKRLALQGEPHQDNPELKLHHHEVDQATLNCYNQLKKYLSNTDYWNNQIYQTETQSHESAVIVLGDGTEINREDIPNDATIESIEDYRGRTVEVEESSVGDSGFERTHNAMPVYLPIEACSNAIDTMDEARNELGFALSESRKLPPQGFSETGDNYYER